MRSAPAATARALIALLALALSAGWLPAALADAGRGGILYETRCSACHERSVHDRDARKAKSFDALRAQVLRWSAQAGGVWTAEEIDDVTLYLNERYYRFPCPQRLCKANHALNAR